MKINKKNITLIALVAVMMIPIGSCKKNFLTQTNTFQSTADATFQKASDVTSLVNSIYDGYQNSDLLKKSIWYYANFFAHDFFNDGGDIPFNSYTVPATFGAIQNFWNNAYIDIGRANAAIGIIANAKAKGILTTALANRLTGEVYFLRGLSYYYLAGCFGGVPLELNAVSNGLTPRSTQEQVFTQVVSDMKNAETYLLSKKDLATVDLGRATKGAAYAYEGAAQMWLGKYTEALAAFNSPELTNNYHLLDDFIQVNEFNNQNNDESLFEIQFDLPPGGSQSWDGNWQNGGELAWLDDFSWPQEIDGFGYDYGNPGLWYSYQSGDRRKLATIVGPGDALVSPGIIAKWGGIKGYPSVVAGFASGVIFNSKQKFPTYQGDDGKIINTCGSLRAPWYGSDGTRSGYYCSKKWRDYNLDGASQLFGSQNQILMRYAEVLLDRAECKVRTGDVPGAMADLKLVRDRAWGKNIGGTVAPPMQDGLTFDGHPTQPITDPLQMVLSEYRHELAGEYSLFFNLRRAGPGVAAAFIQGNYGSSTSLVPQPYPYGPTADGTPHGVWFTNLTTGRDLLPLPQNAIDLNPNLKQNPGY